MEPFGLMQEAAPVAHRGCCAVAYAVRHSMPHTPVAREPFDLMQEAETVAGFQGLAFKGILGFIEPKNLKKKLA